MSSSEPQREPGAGREREHRAQPMTRTEQVVVEIRAPDLELLTVPDACRRGDHDPGPADVRAPAQVDVLAVERHRAIEAAERPEQVGAGEQAGRRHGEHVGDCVVLLLVVLALLDARRRLAEAVDVDADVLQDGVHRPSSRAWDR